MSGGGKKKGQRKSNQSPSDQGVSEDLIEQVLNFDEDTMQDMMRKLRTRLQVSRQNDCGGRRK